MIYRVKNEIGYKGKYESRGPHSNSIKKTGWFLYFAAERCSLDIDVDEEQETTKCEYCGDAILIDRAIEKYKIEV